MDLQEIETIGLQPAETLLETIPDVARAVVVRERRRCTTGGSPIWHPHFDARKNSSSSIDQVPPDQFLAVP